MIRTFDFTPGVSLREALMIIDIALEDEGLSYPRTNGQRTSAVIIEEGRFQYLRVSIPDWQIVRRARLIVLEAE